MNHISNEKEQQRFTSSSDFRLNRLQLNQTPYRCLVATYEIQINKQTWILGSVIYNYGCKGLLVLEIVLRLSGEFLSGMKSAHASENTAR